jgi:ABC-type nitrate/sulfonate/bicarbonate transport system substrate-binding protein
MDTIQIVYRDVDRTPLLYLLADAAAKHEQLAVVLHRIPDGHAYEDGFLSGKFDVICEHLRFLFPARLAGYPVRCLAACQNRGGEHLLARDGVSSIEALAGLRVAVRATESSRLSALRWLRYLGLEDRVQPVVIDDAEIGRWQQWRRVANGGADAVVCSPLYAPPALAAGLHRLHAPALPEIGSLFLAALGPFVENHEPAIRKLMRALYRAIYSVHHDRASALSVMAGKPAELMGLTTEAELLLHYEALRETLDEAPLPRLDSLAMTMAILQEGYAPLQGMNPLSLWDLHYALELEEHRFMEQIAAGGAEPAGA